MLYTSSNHVSPLIPYRCCSTSSYKGIAARTLPVCPILLGTAAKSAMDRRADSSVCPATSTKMLSSAVARTECSASPSRRSRRQGG